MSKIARRCRDLVSSLRFQAVVATVLMIAGVVFATTVSLFNQRQLLDYAGKRGSKPRQRQAVCEILMAALTCRSLEHDCASNPNPLARVTTLRRWRSSEARLERMIDVYANLCSPRHQAMVADWKTMAERYRAEFLAAVNEHASPSEAASDALPAHQQTLNALLWQAERRAQVLGITTEVKQHQLDRMLARTLWMVVLRFIVASAVLATISVWFFRRVLKRIRQLHQAVSHLSSGDLDVRVNDPARDELGALAACFNQMADAIARSQGRLRREIEQHGATILELVAAKEAAQVANRAKTQFLANMSHEIRTPMTSILGFADVLIAACDSPDSRHAALTIKRNGEYLLNVLNDVLDLSKIEAGRLQIERAPCSVCQIVGEVLSLARLAADAKGLPIHLEYRGPIPETIQSDPTRLRQILLNLVGNAIKFTESGFVRLVVSLERSPARPPTIRFEIADTGIGIAADQLARLFQPFSQADSSITRRFGGTGLGLAISKRLTEMLGGSLVVKSVPGRGSTFTLALGTGPLDGVRLLDSPTEVFLDVKRDSAAEHPIRLNCRVLLAEDGPDNQRLMEFILTRAGAEVTIAQNGQEAVARYTASLTGVGSERPYDVILMDIQMPEMDGYEATRRLRAAGHRVPIIALTAHAMIEDRHRCLAAGCTDYLSKPVNAHKLIEMVAHHARPRGSAVLPRQREASLTAKL
jgi:signal transduction histidine kinase/FixJ family two-component response regulator